MEVWIKDLKFAFRLLLKSPIFSLVAVLSLALGIGANTTIFTLVNAVFLNPLPVERSSELVSLFTTDEHNRNAGLFGANLPVSFENYEDYRDTNRVFSGLAAYTFTQLSLSGQGEPEMISGELVTGNYFDVLGLTPSKGRFFRPEEDQTPGAHPVAVISYGLWQRRFGMDEGIVGRTLDFNNQAFTVVGIGPKGFSGLSLPASSEVWVPSMMHQQVLTGVMAPYFRERRALLFGVVGRLKPGISLGQAQSDIQALASGLRERFPVDNRGRSALLMPLAQSTMPANLRSMMVQAGTVLMTVVGLVLLISCANVANLLLSRAVARRREIALRLSLGASRSRLVRQLLTESVLLALLGGVAGLGVAYWARGLLWAWRPPFLQQAALDLSLDVRVLGFTLILSGLTGILFGLLPALQASQADVVSSLKEEASPAGRLSRRFGARNLLVMGQLALSTVSLVGAGLFLRSLGEAHKVDAGFESQHLIVLDLNLGAQGYEQGNGLEFYRQASERISGLPGVRSAAFSQVRPLAGTFMRSVFLEGQDAQGGSDDGRLVMVNVVGKDYFPTAGIPLMKGREFTDSDIPGQPLVAVINETMARSFWPQQEVLGKRFTFFGDQRPVEVVGVARDSKYTSLGEAPQPFIYQPLRQNYSEQMTLYVRTQGDPDPLLVPVQREMRRLDADLALTGVAAIGRLIDDSLWAPKLGAALLGIFGILALTLAAVGIYGVMAYAVGCRRHEIGIRLALGASRLGILRMVIYQGMSISAVGMVCGLAVALLLSGQVSALLWVSALDPLTYAAAALILAAVSLLANLFPAGRATSFSPMLSLRGSAQRG